MDDDLDQKMLDDFRKSKPLIDKALNSHAAKSLEPVKEQLRTNKQRMRTCQYFLCDRCDTPILDPALGFVIHGNVYVADPAARGGLIGNNFPRVQSGDKIEVTDVKESVFCRDCLVTVLGLDVKAKFNPKIPPRLINKGGQKVEDFAKDIERYLT